MESEQQTRDRYDKYAAELHSLIATGELRAEQLDAEDYAILAAHYSEALPSTEGGQNA
jgi:hypothetical protein